MKIMDTANFVAMRVVVIIPAGFCMILVPISVAVLAQDSANCITNRDGSKAESGDSGGVKRGLQPHRNRMQPAPESQPLRIGCPIRETPKDAATRNLQSVATGVAEE